MEQSSAKGNKRIKLWLFNCEESKLIILTSFLLYMISVDALENNSCIGKKGGEWTVEAISISCLSAIDKLYISIRLQDVIFFYLSYTFMYLQLSCPDILFSHCFSIMFDGNFCRFFL